MLSLPSMPVAFSNQHLNADNIHHTENALHDFRSPQACDDSQQHRQQNSATVPAIVTPSPATNSVTMNTTTPTKYGQLDWKSATSEKRKEDLNPFQMAAAFFGINLGGEHGQRENEKEEAGKIDECDSSIPDPPILTSTIQPKRSSSSVVEEEPGPSSSSQPSARRAIPIPSSSEAKQHPPTTDRKESFYEANHRRHSAPTEMTPSSAEHSSSELMESSLSFGPHNAKSRANAAGGAPQDFYDPKDGHLWRAKYCVLEDGVLYFYRNANDGECSEAAAERKESHSDESGTFHSSPPRNDFAAPTLVSIPPSKSVATLSRRRSSAQDLSQSPMVRPMLHHLDSSECRSSDTMWEKRVFLDCIEEVRTAENQFGKNSFELTAVSDEDSNQVDKLVLQAPNLDEMNEWIFQFHRSLASFMRNIMDVFGSTSSSGAFLDIDRPPSMLTPLSSSHHTPLRVAGSIPHSPSEKQLQRLMSMSPRFHHHMQGFGSLPIQPTLSHGHGRTSLRRRADLKRTSSEGASVSSTPEGGDEDSPQHHFAFREPSPSSNLLGTPETISPPVHFLIPPPTVGAASSLPAAPNLRDSLLVVDRRHTVATSPLHFQSSEPERSGPAVEVPEMERPKPATGKYIPPHLRNKQVDSALHLGGPPESGVRKYVPPHMRQRVNDATPGVLLASGETMSLAERAQLAPSTPARGVSLVETIIPPQDDLDIVGVHIGDFVRGGCADPHLIQGSILDQAFIPKRAGRVPKNPSVAFGSFGGGLDEQDANIEHNSTLSDSRLRWEIGAISECGVRDYNEDSFLISNDLLNALEAIPSQTSSRPLWTREAASHNPGLFAIFDGHCGNQAARFAVERFGHYIKEQLHLDILRNAPFGPENVASILRDALMKMDAEFCFLCQEGGREWESGATALVAMIVNEHLVIANLGDCRGILCRSVEDASAYARMDGWVKLEDWDDDLIGAEQAVSDESNCCFFREVTNTHTPAVEEERARIENANGWITTDQDIPIAQFRRMDFLDEDVRTIFNRCIRYSDGNATPSISASERSTKECNTAPHRILHISRVCGELAVSRALGDRDFKAAFNVLSDQQEEAMTSLGSPQPPWWDSPLFFTYPDDHNRRFQGDLVSGIPDIQQFKVGEDGATEEFLLLACDGLWDVLDTDDAVRVVRDLLFRKKWTAKRAAARLAELAIHLGSSDNVTVIIVRLFAANFKRK
jgi:serine/threonine protein phosphatase PrpC